MSSWFNADSNEALFGSSTRVFSNSKESSRRPIIGLSSPKEKQNAYPIIWNQPKKIEDHIMIGTFHVVCAYFKMIGKKMEGTGLSDILLEAGMGWCITG
jgi:hypothetical protein